MSDPHSLADDAPALQSSALPRFQIIHFLAWMAATAAALAPWHFSSSTVQQRTASAAVTAELAISLALSSIYGVAAGSYLFVSVAAIIWRRRGQLPRFLPGHWLALQGAVDSCASAVMLRMLVAPGGSYGAMRWFQLTNFLVGAGFFFFFLWLAKRRSEPPRWRMAFAIMAMAPVVSFLALTILFVSIGSSGRNSLMVVTAAAPGGQSLALGAALLGDFRSNRVRHWSHWLGASSRCLALLAMTAIYLLYTPLGDE